MSVQSDTASYRRYRVTPEDRHLRDIARKLLGDPCDWSRLWHANWAEVADPARLRPGQILRIPAEQKPGKRERQGLCRQGWQLKSSDPRDERTPVAE